MRETRRVARAGTGPPKAHQRDFHPLRGAARGDEAFGHSGPRPAAHRALPMPSAAPSWSH
jgi:hypothetical protein